MPYCFCLVSSFVSLVLLASVKKISLYSTKMQIPPLIIDSLVYALTIRSFETWSSGQHTSSYLFFSCCFFLAALELT